MRWAVLVVLVAVCVGQSATPRNVLFGWGLFGAGVVLHRGNKSDRGWCIGVGIAALLWVGGISQHWYHCIGYSVLCTMALRWCHELFVLAVGVGLGVTTFMVCFSLRPTTSPQWGPYWVAAWIYGMWRMEVPLRFVLRTVVSILMVVAGWEFATWDVLRFLGQGVKVWSTILVTLVVVFGRPQAFVRWFPLGKRLNPNPIA